MEDNERWGGSIRGNFLRWGSNWTFGISQSWMMMWGDCYFTKYIDCVLSSGLRSFLRTSKLICFDALLESIERVLDGWIWLMDDEWPVKKGWVSFDDWSLDVKIEYCSDDVWYWTRADFTQNSTRLLVWSLKNWETGILKLFHGMMRGSFCQRIGDHLIGTNESDIYFLLQKLFT